jgi:hypothetical protein
MVNTIIDGFAQVRAFRGGGSAAASEFVGKSEQILGPGPEQSHAAFEQDSWDAIGLWNKLRPRDRRALKRRFRDLRRRVDMHLWDHGRGSKANHLRRAYEDAADAL